MKPVDNRQLPDDPFIMATPTRPTHRTTSENRRAGGRHPLDVPATLQNDHGPVAVRLTELSVAGVGLNADRPLQPGDVYALTAFDSLVPAGLRVRIVSARQDPAGHYVLGAAVV